MQKLVYGPAIYCLTLSAMNGWMQTIGKMCLNEFEKF